VESTPDSSTKPNVSRSNSDSHRSLKIPNSSARYLELLFGGSPYNGFDTSRHKVDLQGWGSINPLFSELVSQSSPDRIIEVGSWKGASAVHFANLTRDLGLETVVFCIDTWLGSIEHWEKRGDEAHGSWFDSLELSHGYPQLYFQFLHNVIATGNAERIVPIPNTSSMAAQWLKAHDIDAPLIYLDGSHYYADVLRDIIDYYPLVRSGGYLFGDDFQWDGVAKAIKEFCRKSALSYDVTPDGRAWVLEKK